MAAWLHTASILLAYTGRDVGHGLRLTVHVLGTWNAAWGRLSATPSGAWAGIEPVCRTFARDGPALVLFVWLLCWAAWHPMRQVARRTLFLGLAALVLVAGAGLAAAYILRMPPPQDVYGAVPVYARHVVRVPMAGAYLALALAARRTHAPGGWALGLLAIAVGLSLPLTGAEWPLETLFGAGAALVGWSVVRGVRPLRRGIERAADAWAHALGLVPAREAGV